MNTLPNNNRFAFLLIVITFFSLALFTTVSHAYEANAENKNFSKVFGDYTVYYSLFNSTFLQPDIASAARIVRGKDRAVLNISVRKRKTDNTDEAVTAQVSGKSNDLMRDFPLEFFEIKEPGAIYYLAQFDHFNEETRNFTVTVKVDDQTAPFEIRFSQKLWHSESDE
jgi:hypothetical protein